MPQGLIPDEGAQGLFQAMIGSPNPFTLPWTLIFFSNNITPGYATVVADLVEPTWNGYLRKQLDRTAWLFPVPVKGCLTATYGATPITWPVNAASTDLLYGWAIWDQPYGVLRWIQRFEPGDIVPLQVGWNVTLLPTITLTSAPCGSTMLRAGSTKPRSRKRAKHG